MGYTVHKVQYTEYAVQGILLKWYTKHRAHSIQAGHEVDIADGYTVHKLRILSTNGEQYIRLHMIHRVHSSHRVHRSLGTHFEFIQL